MSKKVWLSPSSLSLFNDCERCFWLERNEKRSRPRGIFPSLPGGMDLILKRHYDNYRAHGVLPPEIRGAIQGALYHNQEAMDRWRNWRTGLKAETNIATVGGALDELLVDPDGTFSPYDYKTKGSIPKAGDSERYYGHQLDVYAFMLRYNGMKPSGQAFLAYYSPADAAPGSEDLWHIGRLPVVFNCTVVPLTASPERAADLINRAADCVRSGLPASSPTCEHCRFVTDRAGLPTAAALAAAPAPDPEAVS